MESIFFVVLLVTWSVNGSVSSKVVDIKTVLKVVVRDVSFQTIAFHVEAIVEASSLDSCTLPGFSDFPPQVNLHPCVDHITKKKKKKKKKRSTLLQ